MILVFRHRDSRGNQKYRGDINICPSSGIPSSVFQVKGKGNITNNLQYILLPIDVVLAGQQEDEKKFPKYITNVHGILKKIIFGE